MISFPHMLIGGTGGGKLTYTTPIEGLASQIQNCMSS